MLRMLECGTPVTLTSPPFAHAPQVGAEAMVDALADVLMQTARRDGQLLVVVRDFEDDAVPERDMFRSRGWTIVDSLPNTYLDVNWTTAADYIAAMRSYFRSKLQKHLKRNATVGVRHEVVSDFAPLAETLCRQWQNVHDRASEFQREVLTADFYRDFSDSMGDASRVILFYRGEELAGHALLFIDVDTLRWLYFGREVAANDSLYIYVGYAVIETAIKLGLKRIEMGLTNYPVKLDLGAQPMPIRMALRARWRWVNPLLSRLYPILNEVPEVSAREVFKKRSGA